jgi:hypothetical protein
MKTPLVVTFCNSPQLSHHVGLNLFNIIKLVTLHCFLQLAGTRRSRTQQGQGSREGVGATECCVSPEIHYGDSPVSRGIVMVQDSTATSQVDVCAQRHGSNAGLFHRITYLLPVL